MGVLVDIVPNHMGVASPEENAWWWDLLRLGRSSAYADAFDVDWEAFGGRVMVPVLGDDGEPPHSAYPQPAQHYELVSWRRGDSELNYRRFFTITTLAGVRVEDPRVFAESHREIGRWCAEGLVDGLRVDHPDGLRDPRAYLDDLAQLTGGAYVLVEKILEPGESLSPSWATAGTTGYDVLGLIDRVLVDPAGQAPLDAIEARLRGGPVDWASLTHDTRRAVADGPLLAEVRRIVREDPLTGSRARARWRLAHSTTRSSRLTVTVEPRRAEAVHGRARRDPSRSKTPSPSSSRASRSTAPTSPRASSTSRQRSPLRGVTDPIWPAPWTSSRPSSPTQPTRQR